MAADVASALKDWSTTAASNSPAGSTAISTNLDDNLREIQAVVRDLASPNTVASATTTDIGAVNETFLTISGTTTITGLGTVSAGIYKWLIFSGALTFTHNATSLILPSGGNITTAAGDCALMLSLGSGNWRCLSYSRADGSTVGAVSMNDGTASLPGLSFISDTNTGIYRVGADSIGIAAGGANVATFNTTGMSITGTFAPSTVSVTGSFSTNIAAGGTLSIATASYLSNENSSPSDIYISAGSANNFSKVGGDIFINSGWGTSGPGNVSIYSAAPSGSNVDSGTISIYTGTAERDTGSISLVTGDSSGGATGDGSGAISILTGDGFDVGNIDIGTGVPSGTNNYGAIRLYSRDVEVLSISKEIISITGSNPPAITSGAGSGATISGGKSKFIITCGSSAGATIVVTDAEIENKAFYYFSAGVSAPRPMYGGVTDGSGVFTIVLPVAPSSGHKIHVYCLG